MGLCFMTEHISNCMYLLAEQNNHCLSMLFMETYFFYVITQFIQIIILLKDEQDTRYKHVNNIFHTVKLLYLIVFLPQRMSQVPGLILHSKFNLFARNFLQCYPSCSAQCYIVIYAYYLVPFNPCHLRYKVLYLFRITAPIIIVHSIQ